MNKKTKLICVLLGMMLLSSTANAKDKQETKAIGQKLQTPIVIEADELTYSDEVGDIMAKGNVKITQNGDRLTTDMLSGNTKETELHIDGSGNMRQEKLKLTGTGIIYNYGNHTGTMDTAQGALGSELIAGESFSISPGYLQFAKVSVTKCPAHGIQCYHISANKIEMWPGQKMIAYDVKFWIRGKVIFSMPKYEKSLKNTANNTSPFPKAGYDSTNGMYVKQYLEYPIGDNIAAWGDLTYYSRSGLKPMVGLLDRESSYTITLSQGSTMDANSNWIKKEPEFNITFDPVRLGKLPISYRFSAVYGKWSDDKKSSWHQDYSLYFKRDDIKLSSSLTWTMGTGVELIKESYDSSQTESYRFDTGLYKTWSPRLSTYELYHYIKNNNRVFEFNSDKSGRSLESGITYKVDRMNTLVVASKYDFETNTYSDIDYTLQRKLHCWQLDVTYRAKCNMHWHFNVSTTKF